MKKITAFFLIILSVAIGTLTSCGDDDDIATELPVPNKNYFAMTAAKPDTLYTTNNKDFYISRVILNVKNKDGKETKLFDVIPDSKNRWSDSFCQLEYDGEELSKIVLYHSITIRRIPLERYNKAYLIEKNDKDAHGIKAYIVIKNAHGGESLISITD